MEQMEKAKTPEIKHPMKKKIYESFASNPEKQQKYLEFITKNPDIKSIKWDEEKKEFVDAAKYSVR